MKSSWLAFISSLMLCCAAARADDFNITLTQSSLSGLPGDVVTFAGTVDNTTGSDVFLNADNFSLSGLDPSAIDDSPFWLNAPLFLGPNGTTGDIGLFNIVIPNGLAPGIYGGTFEILGGSTADDQTIVGSVNFEVQVAAATATVPELGSSLLLLSVLLVMGALCKSRRFARTPRRPTVSELV